MKPIFTLLLVLLALGSQAAPKPLITYNGGNAGNWSTATNWTPTRVPQNGDSVVIPASKWVSFNAPASYTNMYINVLGFLEIEDVMTLDNNSIVAVQSTGDIFSLSWTGNTQKIVLGGATKFSRTLVNPVAGPAAANQFSNGFGPIAILPVTFTGFYVNKVNDHQVNLSWSTAQEMNNKTFVVERSYDARNWTSLTEMEGAGTTRASHSYNYTDRNVNGETVYYRIRQVDIDGSFEYSTLKIVRMNSATATADAKVYAYNKNLTVEFNVPVKNTLLVRVLNMNGQMVAQQPVQHASYKANMNLANAINGVYVVQITDGNGFNQTTKVVL